MMIITDGLPRGLGYYEIDNRGADIPPGMGQRHFEADTYTCTHCTAVVVLNPDRKRARYKCKGCNHHICDACAVHVQSGGQCVTFQQYVDDSLDRMARQLPALPFLPHIKE